MTYAELPADRAGHGESTGRTSIFWLAGLTVNAGEGVNTVPVSPVIRRSSRELLDYNTVRSTIPDGAIMLSAGRGLAASIIRLWTRSDYSHCGILFWLGMNKEHLMLVEAVDQGIQMVRLSNYLERAKKDRRMVAYGFHPQVGPTNIVPIKNHAIHLSGKPYDYAGLVGMGLDMLVDLPGESHDLPQKDKYVCSRVVLECLLAGGVRLEHRFGRITPDDVAKQCRILGRLT